MRIAESDPEWARVVVYRATPEGWQGALDDAVKHADLLVKASGVGVFDRELESAIDPPSLAQRSIGTLTHRRPSTTSRNIRCIICARKSRATTWSDRLLGVDLSYRLTAGMQHIKHLIQAGELGRVHYMDLTFHNAYGPDKPWFYDPSLSGGGCLMDLGVHLIDLALWLSESASVVDVSSHLFAAGERLAGRDQVEDLALATLTLDTGCVVRIACSWRTSAGQDADIRVDLHGTKGGAAMRNAGGSFYDFVTERFRGTSREQVASYPELWGGRMAAEWAIKLANGARFDSAVLSVIDTAAVIDRIYRTHR